MKYLCFAFCLVLMGMSGCNSTSNTTTSTSEVPDAAEAANQQLQSEMWDKVMVVHDEVMPKMSELNRIGRNLKAVEAVPEEMQPKVEAMLTTLDNAGEGMMAWMSGFKQLENLRKDMDHAGIMAYLKGEMEKIATVKTDMENGIEAGKALLDQLTSKN